MLLRSESTGRPRRRGLIFAVSVAFHLALGTAGVAYGYWHVDEVEPPPVRVPFVPVPAMAPPPRDPPPPSPRPTHSAGPKAPEGQQAPAVEPSSPPEGPELPPAAPSSTTEHHSDQGAIDPPPGGDNQPGAPRGGGMGPASGCPSCQGHDKEGRGEVVLAPDVGAGYRLTEFHPSVPDAVRRLGGRRQVLVKVCVSATGSVTGVTVLRGDLPELDQAVLDEARRQRYRAYQIEGRAVPFCHALNVVVDMTP